MDFRGDERGQPVVIGSLLIFAILILAFSGYQAVVVPNQNADVEFQHDQKVQPQFIDIRNGAMRAVASGESPFLSLKLGTEYPSRLFALNPPNPTGTLRTTPSNSFEVSDVSNVCRGDDETRALEYKSAYNEYNQNPTYRFENTVAYRQFEGDTRIDTDQRLIKDRTINLVPIQGELSESSTQTVSVEPIAGEVKRTEVTNPVVTVPTKLEETKWEDLLEGEVDKNSVTVTDGELKVELEGDYIVRCAPVAFNTPPNAGARGEGSLEEPNQPGIINPRGTHGIVLTGVNADNAQNGQVTLVLQNQGEETRTIEKARIPFHYGTGIEEFELDGDILAVKGDFVTLTNPVDIQAGETTNITLENPEGKNIREDLTSFSIRDDRDLELTYVTEVLNADIEQGGGAASNIQVVNSPTSAGTSNSEVHFELENTGSNPVTVKGISFDDTTNSDAAAISTSNNENEIIIDEIGHLNTGGISRGIDQGNGEYVFDSTAEIGGNSISQFELISFVDSTEGDANPTSMSGEDVTLTLFFNDGTSKQITLDNIS